MKKILPIVFCLSACGNVDQKGDASASRNSLSDESSQSHCERYADYYQLSDVIEEFPVYTPGQRPSRPKAGYCYESNTGFEGSKTVFFDLKNPEDREVCISEAAEWINGQGHTEGFGSDKCYGDWVDNGTYRYRANFALIQKSFWQEVDENGNVISEIEQGPWWEWDGFIMLPGHDYRLKIEQQFRAAHKHCNTVDALVQIRQDPAKCNANRR